MESPSAQLQPTFEESIIFDADGTTSSPFVTEVETNPSRSPSRQHYTPSFGRITEAISIPADLVTMSPTDVMEDKENVLQGDNMMQKIFASPEKGSTPEPVRQRTPSTESTRPAMERSESADSGLMPPPPPSGRKIHTTPKKTPLKPSRSAANTSKTNTRGNSFEDTARTPSAFQAGLDVRASQMTAQDATNVDDTCFSTFSEIPEMILFAKLGQSPTKRGDMTPCRNDTVTSRTSRKRLSISRSPSPTPRRQKTPAANADGTTTFLIDFTQQIEGVPGSLNSPGKSTTMPNLLQHLNNQRSPAKSTRQSYVTPSKPNNILNLLDFELPPAPTPRSVPTITVRELESLKSSYLSQMSSLKATLSGREAEVESLKKAVIDAERRVGEAQESVREERCRREDVEQEKADWEKRGKEVEAVLKSVKEEVMKGETEKEDLFRRLEDAEHQSEDAEARAVKAEERFADTLAARADTAEGSVEEKVQGLVAAQIDAKIEAVSRELHAVYKEKHERKVATLKKSYEARSDKKTAELQTRLVELERSNEELLATKDDTFSGPVKGEQSAADAELKAQMLEQQAHLARLESEMQASKQQQHQLMGELEQERVEKGDLVAAVDEMLALQAEGQAPASGAMSVVEDFRKSISRPSGLRAPRGGLPAPSGIGRSTSGGKSRMLANIERMGRTGAAPTMD